MDAMAEEAKTRVESEKPEDVWFQITFTIDPENYKRLWAYAESVNSSISSVARASVLNHVKNLKTSPRLKKIFSQANSGDPM